MYFAEEDQNPTRNLPRSLVATVLSCTAICLLINGALIHVLGMERLQLAKVPAAEASLSVFGSYGRQIMLVISIITVNQWHQRHSPDRSSCSLDRLLPSRLTSINQGGLSSLGSVSLPDRRHCADLD
jgi:APA family basic amino acid/polyamine antiporter